MTEDSGIHSVMVTGATGFVGRRIVRDLLARGVKPICLVRSPKKLFAQHSRVSPERLAAIVGSLSDEKALRVAAELSQAAIHLVGIIVQRPLHGQTFTRIHERGTRNVIDALERAGVKRYVHMSALGSRPGAVAPYHQTKWNAEEMVRGSGLDWTIFRPSLIHGPTGEFMELMHAFMCGLVPPVIPYFGDGSAKLQPVSVKDVAKCFVESVFREDLMGKVIPLGGPNAYSWVEFYNACRTIMPHAKRWKPLVGQPVPVAKMIATLGAPLMALTEAMMPSMRKFRFDKGQVQMSQEDSVCDAAIAETTFGIKMRSFEEELALYADRIGVRGG